MNGLRSIRGLKPDSLRGLKPSEISESRPAFEEVDPRTIFVEEGYQRDIGQNGIALIRKIYSGFSWARFKPPVCVRVDDLDGVLVCIDGQHTATAAASHPGLKTIPVMIVPAAAADLRAAAFVGHNRERLSLTPQAIYRAELAGGDELAVTVDRACRQAGAQVLGKPISLREKHPIGATIAIGTMKAVALRSGEESLVRTLRVLVGAERGPIKAAEITAAALILSRAGDHPTIDYRLQTVIASKSAEAWAALGGMIVARTREPIGSAIASEWCRALNIQLPSIDRRAATSRGSSRFLDQALKTPPPSIGVESPVKAPAPRPAQPVAAPKPPPPPPVAKKPVPAPQPPPPPIQGEAVVQRNGVLIDLRTREVSHRQQTVKIRDDGIRLVAALVKVMPAFLDGSMLARQAFHVPATADEIYRLRFLIEDVNPFLARTGLEIRTIPKMGFMIADLGDSGITTE